MKNEKMQKKLEKSENSNWEFEPTKFLRYNVSIVYFRARVAFNY